MTQTGQKPVQSKLTMAIAALFMGTLGLHRFLMGYKNWWLMTISFGGLGLWAFWDFIQIILGKMKMADGRPLKDS